MNDEEGPLDARIVELTPKPTVALQMGASELPGGRAAVTVHLGTYDKLEATYRRLHDWIHEEGFEEGPGPWESYVDDPEEVDDPSQLRTEVVWPLG